MFLGEPQRTQADLNLSLFGFPVRISPFFWVVAALLGWNAAHDEPRLLLIWIAVVLLAVLVHELGHALAFRYFGQPSRIVLYHFGGVTVPETWGGYGSGRRFSPRQQILISAAGPAAGFALAAAIVAALFAARYPVQFYVNPAELIGWRFVRPLEMLELRAAVHFLLFANIYWGVINLLPVYPLDGGQIVRELLALSGNRDAVRQSLLLSIVIGGGVALWAGVNGRFFLAVMFAMLAFSSYQMLRQWGGYGGGRPW